LNSVPGEPVRHAASYMDPHGYVYREDGRWLRRVHAGSHAWVRAAITTPVVRELMAARMLVGSRIRQDDRSDGGTLVLEHDGLAPVTYAPEWTPSALRDAALLTLRVLKRLAESGMTLQDATPWNVVFDGPSPIFVDFTSIVEESPAYIWPAEPQFHALFRRPLVMCAQRRGAMARALLCNPIAGVDHPTFWNSASLGYRFTHPIEWLVAQIADRIQKDEGSRRKLIEANQRRSNTVPRAVKLRFIEAKLSELEALEFESLNDDWLGYRDGLPVHAVPHRKLALIEQLLNDLHPASIVDLGANTGTYSFIAARAGAKVTAVDSSEACTERIFRTSKELGLDVSTVLCDLSAPYRIASASDRDFPDLWSRIRSEGVLCLGLMHHLHIIGRQTFDRIAGVLDRTGSKFAILEYVAPEDENVQRLSVQRAHSYTLVEVANAMRQHFPRIEIMDSDRSTRKLLVCRR